ncbi:MAG: hypothetical protein KJO55_08760 [Gammaproteobacteria bacterium]|nr:hypothetical protein [Gammaproteobacteria bacterium]
MRWLMMMAVLSLAAWPVLAQEEPVEESSETDTETEQQAPVSVDRESFTPTEEVEADTAVAFPTDI